MPFPFVIVPIGLGIIALVSLASKNKKASEQGSVSLSLPTSTLPGGMTVSVPPLPATSSTVPTVNVPAPVITFPTPTPAVQFPGIVAPTVSTSAAQQAGIGAQFQQAIASVLARLVDQNGTVLATVSAADIQAATALAGQLEAAGYKDAANNLREWAKLAGTKVAPKTPAAQVPLPGLSQSIQDGVNRVLQTERDPKKIREYIAMLRAMPAMNSVEGAALIAMLDQLATQLEAQNEQGRVLNTINQVLTAATPAAVEAIPSVPPVKVSVPTLPVPAALTPLQLAAKAMVANLIQVQLSAGSVVKAKGKEDKSLVAAFQKLLGASVDYKTGPGTLLAAARAGQTKLPLVMYWPTSATQKNVLQYRQDLYTIADQIQATNPSGAQELRDSAGREAGQAGIVGTKPSVTSSTPVTLPTTSIPAAIPTTIPQLATQAAQVLTAAIPGVSQSAIDAARDMIANLKSIQASTGGDVKKAKGKENKTLVGAFQKAVGQTVDYKPGPGLLYLAAQAGQFDLPLVMYWPTSATQAKVFEYREKLNTLANQIQAANPTGASQLRASAARERGQAGIVGPMPA